MTCIIGLCRGQEVWIGGDSTGISDDAWGGILPVATSKVWQQKPFVFGSCGSFRAIQIVQQNLNCYDILTKERRGGTDPINEAFMVNHFVPEIKSLLEKHDFSEKNNERSTQKAEFLIGVHGKLFILQGDYAVVEVASSFTAIGSGMYVALGAMEILTQSKTKRTAANIIERALAATDKHINTVGPPGKIVTTQGN